MERHQKGRGKNPAGTPTGQRSLPLLSRILKAPIEGEARHHAFARPLPAASLPRMKLLQQLEREAAQYGITVNESAKGWVLDAPDGMQFEDELHALVASPWDHEPIPNVLRRAIADVREYGPRIRKCPDDCPCKD